MKKYGISASSVGSPIGKIHIDEDFDKHLEKLSRVIDIAKEIGAKYIRIFSFYGPKDTDKHPCEFRDEVLRRMKEMTRLAEERDVILLHENEKDIYGDTALRALDVLKEVNSPNLRAVFDPANFVQCDEETYPYAFEMLRDYIEYMHIKDSDKDGKIVPAGDGAGNIKEILSTLKKSGYDGFVSLEPHLGSFEGLAELELSDDMLSLEKSTSATFTVAFDALMEIIDNI